jgi:membrane protease YdiL (CAAX protease family)
VAPDRVQTAPNRSGLESPWIAVLVSHVAFVLYHLKDGIENVLCFSVLLLLFPFYYIRYRDLTMVIVAHAFVDLMAIIGHAAGIRG